MSRVAERKDVMFSHYMVLNANGEYEIVRPKPKCADIWMAEISFDGDCVQSGYRPVFVISNDKNNAFAPTVNVFPLTTKMKRKNLPCHVTLYNYYDYGLSAPSTILVEQPLTIPQSWLLKRLGTIEDRKTLNRILTAMQSQFPILQY